MSAIFQHRIGWHAGSAPVAKPPPLHLVYLGAIDLRLCLLASTHGFDLRPVSKIDAFIKNRAGSDGVVLVDAADMHTRALDVLRRIVAHTDNARVMVLCEQGSIGFVRACFRAGALDVLDKSFDDDGIVESLGQAMANERPQGPPAGRRQTRAARFNRLSEREKEVFACLLAGHTSREVAGMLGLSSRTVELHRAHLRDKLQVRNVAQMASDYGFLHAG